MIWFCPWKFWLIVALAAAATDRILPGWGQSYGIQAEAEAACARTYPHAKVIEYTPGNCVIARYESRGARSCAYSTGPTANANTKWALEQLCKTPNLKME